MSMRYATRSENRLLPHGAEKITRAFSPRKLTRRDRRPLGYNGPERCSRLPDSRLILQRVGGGFSENLVVGGELAQEGRPEAQIMLQADEVWVRARGDP